MFQPNLSLSFLLKASTTGKFQPNNFGSLASSSVCFAFVLVPQSLCATYFSHVSLLNEWCGESFLEINVGKTKELVLDASKTIFLFVPVKVNNESVDVVSNFIYLGTLIDNKLSFSDNSDLIYKKIAATFEPLAKAESF